MFVRHCVEVNILFDSFSIVIVFKEGWLYWDDLIIFFIFFHAHQLARHAISQFAFHCHIELQSMSSAFRLIALLTSSQSDKSNNEVVNLNIRHSRRSMWDVMFKDISHNAVASILFQISAFLWQYFIYKLFVECISCLTSVRRCNNWRASLAHIYQIYWQLVL